MTDRDVQAEWFERLMANTPSGERSDEEEDDQTANALADACTIKRSQAEKVMRDCLPPGTRISPGAVTAAASVADYMLRRALSVRTKKVERLNVMILPPVLRPPSSTKKTKTRTKRAASTNTAQ